MFLNLAIKYHAEKFVMISSDKAVNPTNVMGATKKICELLVHTLSKRKDIDTTIYHNTVRKCSWFKWFSYSFV